jgi:hypothetical protein
MQNRSKGSKKFKKEIQKEFKECKEFSNQLKINQKWNVLM